MKAKRNAGLIALATFIVAAAAPYQPNAFADERQDRQNRRLEIMKERLELTDGQVNEIRAIMETARLQAEKDREKFREEGDREGALKAARARQEETERKIKAVLNEKQNKEYDKLKEEMRRRDNNRGDRPGKSRDGKRGGGRRGPGR
jgi:Spy/CpxP family protein refolding chaperone